MQVRVLPCAPVLRAGVTLRFAGTYTRDRSGRSDPARPACRGAWPSLPALEAGDRWFKSTHADHFGQSAVGSRQSEVERFDCRLPILRNMLPSSGLEGRSLYAGDIALNGQRLTFYEIGPETKVIGSVAQRAAGERIRAHARITSLGRRSIGEFPDHPIELLLHGHWQGLIRFLDDGRIEIDSQHGGVRRQADRAQSQECPLLRQRQDGAALRGVDRTKSSCLCCPDISCRPIKIVRERRQQHFGPTFEAALCCFYLVE
jgi:hypothetical protein